MYLWKVRTIVANIQSGGTNRFRHIITNSKRAEDAYARARVMDLSTDESLQEVTLLGSIPSIAESTPYHKPIVYYVVVSYLFPAAPENSNIRRVPSGFDQLIDKTIASKIGLEEKLGPLPVGPDEPVDTSKLAMLVALSAEDIEQARMLISTEIFQGAVPSEDIYVLTMYRVGLALT